MGPSFPTELLPSSARSSELGLVVGGVPVAALAAEHGTPLIVYDEDHLRQRCADVRRAFPDGASYAAKAFLCRSVARLVHEAGLGIDVDEKRLEEESKRPQTYRWPGSRLRDGSIADY